MRDRACQSKVSLHVNQYGIKIEIIGICQIKKTGNNELDSNIILVGAVFITPDRFVLTVSQELMSETSIQLQSQISLGAGNMSIDSAGIPIRAAGLTQAQTHARTKPRFFEFACSYVEVRRTA